MALLFRLGCITAVAVGSLCPVSALSHPADGSIITNRTGSTTVDSVVYYRTVPGRLMGVWPVTYTVAHLARLRTKYGFTHVVVTPDATYDSAIVAGFEPSNIMIDLRDVQYSVDNYPAGMYYKDEPSEHDCAGHNKSGHVYSNEELLTITYYVHQVRPGSLFVISGYKRCSHNNISKSYVDAFMYSSYNNWDDLGFPFYCHPHLGWGDDWETGWSPGDKDQRASWTSMRIMCGAVNFMNWMNGSSDEYSNLFAHANSLGLVGIWQWNPGPIDSANLEAYCLAAWQNGWLSRTAETPVPVQLAAFTAKPHGANTVLLNWLTLSETNNYGFEVQRRVSPAETFSTLPNGFVAGFGTTLKPREYSFVDSAAGSGRLLYRLKQIDLDGSASYSSVQEVAMLTDVRQESGVSGFLLHQNFPNPFNPTTTIAYSVPSKRRVTLTIVDILGREISTLVDMVVAPGTHSVSWNAGDLPSGIYFMRLRAADIVQTRRLVLMK